MKEPEIKKLWPHVRRSRAIDRWLKQDQLLEQVLKEQAMILVLLPRSEWDQGITDWS